MILKTFPFSLTICKVRDLSEINLHSDFYFICKTDEEISLVCETDHIPQNTIDREDGWKCFRIEGILDFSLIGVLSDISTILASHSIGIFVTSTFNTDYILVKAIDFDRAMNVLNEKGYNIK